MNNDNYVFRCSDLSKSYGNTKVLDKVNMNIKKGEIYGLIGKNGAGKTTIIRAICGYINCESGCIELFGKDAVKAPDMRKRCGALIDSPVFYNNMTCRENLEFIRIQRGIPGTYCIDEVLNLSGIKETENIKVKKLSFGMKQRLGIAGAFLSDPEFLILDEPINGLDPIGIQNFREIMLRINEEKGTTILISSHILSELSKICTRFGFANNGSIIEEISVSEYNRKCKNYLNVKVNNCEDAAAVLERKLDITDFEVFDDNIIKIYDSLDSEKISRVLIENNIGIKELSLNEENLEEYFRKLIGGREHE